MYSDFPPSTKTNIFKFQFNLNKGPAWKPAKTGVTSLPNNVKYLFHIMQSLLWERPMPPDTSLYHLSQDLFFFWQLSCLGSLPPLRMVGNFNGQIIQKWDEFSYTLKVNRKFFKAKLSTSHLLTLTSKNIITLGSDSWRLRKYENISLNKRTSSQDGIKDLAVKNHNKKAMMVNL